MKHTPETCSIVKNYSSAVWPKKEDVPERNLELPYSNKLFWMDIDFSKFNEYDFSKFNEYDFSKFKEYDL